MVNETAPLQSRQGRTTRATTLFANMCHFSDFPLHETAVRHIEWTLITSRCGAKGSRPEKDVHAACHSFGIEEVVRCVETQLKRILLCVQSNPSYHVFGRQRDDLARELHGSSLGESSLVGVTKMGRTLI